MFVWLWSAFVLNALNCGCLTLGQPFRTPRVRDLDLFWAPPPRLLPFPYQNTPKGPSLNRDLQPDAAAKGRKFPLLFSRWSKTGHHLCAHGSTPAVGRHLLQHFPFKRRREERGKKTATMTSSPEPAPPGQWSVSGSEAPYPNLLFPPEPEPPVLSFFFVFTDGWFTMVFSF